MHFELRNHMVESKTSKFDKTTVFFQRVKNILLDLFFPKFCIGCNTEGTWLCQNCKGEILPVQMQVCPKCNKMSQSGKYCLRCGKDSALKGIVVSLYFEEGATKELIHNFKYNSIKELTPFLGEKMVQVLRDNPTKIDIITFVPVHVMRMASRGYNQAELLAEYVSQKIEIKIEKLLTKTRNTKRQVGLKRQQRKNNLSGAFKANQNVDISNKKILIIDDVTTTGQTLEECAKVLKNAGAKEVWGLVISRG